MYFRAGGFLRNRDMYFKVGFTQAQSSISRVNTGQIDPLALVLFAHKNQFADSKGSCTLVIAPPVAGMLEDARDVFEIV